MHEHERTNQQPPSPPSPFPLCRLLFDVLPCAVNMHLPHDCPALLSSASPRSSPKRRLGRVLRPTLLRRLLEVKSPEGEHLRKRQQRQQVRHSAFVRLSICSQGCCSDELPACCTNEGPELGQRQAAGSPSMWGCNHTTANAAHRHACTLPRPQAVRWLTALAMHLVAGAALGFSAGVWAERRKQERERSKAAAKAEAAAAAAAAAQAAAVASGQQRGGLAPAWRRGLIDSPLHDAAEGAMQWLSGRQAVLTANDLLGALE